jgi:hypothetical protein
MVTYIDIKVNNNDIRSAKLSLMSLLLTPLDFQAILRGYRGAQC